MKLSIVSLKGEEWNGEAVSLNVKTAAGEITVLDNHHPMISVLAKGSAVVVTPKGDKAVVPINSGCLSVDENNNVRILKD